jgi:hypothetical protein
VNFRSLLETVQALLEIKANIQAEILQMATTRWLSQTRELPPDIEAYCEEALMTEFEDFDLGYYNCKPTTMDQLEARLRKDETLFITRVP